MNDRILFKNARVASDKTRNLTPADVLVETGRIAGVSASIEPPRGVRTIDCAGKVLVPALFDMHVHFRQPGREDKETIETGSEAAINGGITGVVAMPNTNPAIDNGGMVRFVLNLARDVSRIPVFTSGCITKGQEGNDLAEIADMRDKGAVMITDDGDPVANSRVLRRALEYSRDFGLIVASHCEDKQLSGPGAMNEGETSYKLGIPGIPACSEEICLVRDCRLAQYTKGRLHIQHVTTAHGMEAIRRFKEEGANVTCEVSPHHLIFSDEDIVDFDTHYKMNPPLRSPKDREWLLEGLNEGVINVIATDHAPHTPFEKALDFAHAPFGITGLETALISLHDRFIRTGRLGWDVLVRAYSSTPRRYLNLPNIAIEEGNSAEFLVFDPNARTRVDREFMRSKSINTPFLDKELQGSVEKVLRHGEFLLDRVGGAQ